MNKFKWLPPVLIALCITVAVCWSYLWSPDFLRVMELKAYDLRLEARGQIPVSDRVALIAIDEKSLETVGRWPWSREVMADLVREIDACGPKALGFDISFFDPQESPAGDELINLAKNAEELGLLPNPELAAYIKKRLAKTNPDLLLARTLASARSPQVLGYYFNLDPGAEKGRDTLQSAVQYPVQRFVGKDKNVALKLPRGYKARTNIPLLARASGEQAYFNVIPDMDGTIRRYPLAIDHGGKYFAPLAAGLARLSDSSEIASLMLSSSGMIGVRVGDFFVPSDERGYMLLDFRGPAGSIPTYPAWKLFTKNFAENELKDKYVLLGVTAPGVYDLRVTPVGVAYPGLEIQATALDQILAGDFISRPAWAPLFDLAAIWVLGLFCLIFLWRLSPFLSLAGFAAAGAGYIIGNYYLLAAGRYWVSMVYPLLALGCNYLALNVYRFMFADRQKRRIRKAFSKYLDPNVVQQVVANPERLCLGGEKQELTVLFSDIRGFTSISEGLEPGQLVRLLNAYLTRMTKIITQRRGLLDKYIGDAIMAVFGAPLHFKDHSAQACLSGLLMVRELKEFNKEWEESLGKPLDIGVGINTGEMVAGNMGSEDRFDYTVMGDHVNLASRLEGLNKQYGTRLIVSEYTRNQALEGFWFRSLDLVQVKGRDKAVAIFELLAEKSMPCPLGYLDEYEQMVEMYRKGQFVNSREVCARLMQDNPQDPVLKVYARRLEQLIASPPEEWTGVYIFSTK